MPAGQARAAAFQLKENSAAALGTAYAGAGSSADTPATVFNNPAGMTQLPDLQVSLGGSLIAPSFTLDGSARNALGLPIQGANNRDGGNLAFVPQGYVTYQVAPTLAVGLGITTPFGLQTYYGPDFIGRYQADKTELQTIDINPAIAWQALPWLSLGAGVSADYAIAQFSSAINSPVVGYSAFGRFLPLQDGLFRLRGDDWAFGYNFGALITPAPGTKIGVTYRSRIQHDFAGTVTYDVPLPLSLSPTFRNGPAGAKLVLPDTAGISITQRLAPRWTGYADLTWTNWSQFKNLTAYRTDTGAPLANTPEHYDNSVFVSAGASYEATDALTLRGGLAYDTTPVQDAYRTARVPDASRYWLAVGASYRIMPRVTVDVGYAHVFVDDASIRETSATGDVLTGTYSNSIDIVSLGTRLTFLMLDGHAAVIETAPLDTLLREAAHRFPRRPAWNFLGRRTRWAEADAAVDRIAAGLQAAGLEAGARVGLLLPNCPAYPLLFFAALRAGLVVVNFNPLYTPRELAQQARDADLALLATLDLAATYPKAAGMLAEGVVPRLLVCPFAPMLPRPKATLFRALRRHERAFPPRDARHLRLPDLLATRTPPAPVPIDPARDLAVLQYTGGTTGTPKGAMLSHANLYANAVQGVAAFPDTRPGQERILAALPFFHVFAMTTVLLFAVRTASEIVMLPRFVLADAVRTIARRRPTYMPGVPTLFSAIASYAGRADLRSIRYCISGGAPLPPEVKQRFEARTGCVVVEGYGLTEASPCLCCNPPDGANKPGSIGRPMLATELELRDPEQPLRRVHPGGRGELCARGPQVMLGYWRQPEATTATFTPDGWLRTGDIATVDADGYFAIVDRIKDLILCGGYNVFPRVVEDAIYHHPAVAECCVIGVPDAYRGETVKAFVVLRPGEVLTAEALCAFLRDHLSPIEMPKHVVFRDALPRTLVGKLSKKALADEEGIGRATA